MEREEPWEVEQRMDGKTAIKFQRADGKWISLVPNTDGVYFRFVEEFAREINPSERLTPDQQADLVMNNPKRRRGTSSGGIKLD